MNLQRSGSSADYALQDRRVGRQSTEQPLPAHSDNVEEELRRIHLALDAVFSSSPQSNANLSQQNDHWFQQRQLADRYLTSFQGTEISWMVCDRLLQEETETPSTMNCRFFAAQTLHTKCRSDVFELPPNILPSLRDSLLQHLRRYVNAGDALATRLALCISALAVQMEWTSIVSDLLTQSHPSSHSEPLVVLAVLRVLPEECACDRLLLKDEGARFRMRDHLVQSAQVVFNFLQHCLSCRQAIILQTCHTWIRYVPIRPDVLKESPLLQTTVQALLPQSSSADHIEPAADVVVEILRMYPSNHYGNEGLVKAMIPLLSQLPLEQALQLDNEDILRAYCRIVTEMGESYMSWILSREYGQASQLVDWVLKYSSIQDQEIAFITLHFWYRLTSDMEQIHPYDWRQELVDVYTPHLLNLVNVCVASLMRFPDDATDWGEDALDDFHRHRFYVCETVEDCCRLLGGHTVLKRMQELHHSITSAMNQQQQWQGIESFLACMGSIHKFVPPDDDSGLLPMCFQLIPQLPPDVRPLRFTASKMIGRYASWLALHSELLQPLLPYLAQGLHIPECAPAAAVAIKELCECSNASFLMAEPVLSLYEEMTMVDARQTPQMRRPQLELADELQILEGCCRAISRQILHTQNDGRAFLTRLVQPIGNRLAELVADSRASAPHIVPEIDRLTAVVQFLALPFSPGGSAQHPLVELMASTWTLLETATNRFPQDTLLAEKICRLHKHALRAAGAAAYAPILDTLIQQLVQSYAKTHQSPYLYAASICITEYGYDANFGQRLFDMVAAMAEVTFSFLRSFDEMTNHPDVVEEFFYLMGRMMTHCPDQLVSSPLLISLFQSASVGMRLDHHGANKGTLKFLETTISYGLSLREQNKPVYQAALEHALSQEGQAVVANLAYAMVGDLPGYTNQIPEILWKLNLLCPGLLAQWLSAAFGRATLPERAKNDFMGALDTGLARDEFSLAARAFQSACERDRRFRK